MDIEKCFLGHLSRSFTQEEVDLLSDRLAVDALNRAHALVKPIVEELCVLLGDELETKRSNGAFWAGWNMVYAARDYWFGIWVWAWSCAGQSPLMLQVKGALPHDTGWPPDLPDPVGGEWDGVMIPLPIHAQVSRNDTVASISDITAQCMRYVASS